MTLRENVKEIQKIIKYCLYNDDEVVNREIPEGAIIAKGIRMHIAFHPDRLNECEDKIEELINDLPETFNEGWSFLNMCLDRNNNEWTSSHRTMDELLILGLASGKLEYCCEREMWNVLPGGMPYVKRI